MTERTCGGCTACCKTHLIVELGKPARVWCPECEIAKGCKIYDKRPKECRDFKCQWLIGNGTEDERPDRVKVVVDYFDFPIIGETTMVYEVTEGALKNSFAQSVLKARMKKRKPVCFLPIVGNNTIYAPKSRMAFFKALGPFNGRYTDIEYY